MTLHVGGCTAAVAPGCLQDLRAQLEGGPPEAWPGFAVVKESTVRTVRAGRIGAALHVHTKTYRPVRWTDRARDLLQGTRARVEFANLQRARALGLPAVEPLAFGTTAATPVRSFLITRSVPDADPVPRRSLPPELAANLGALLRRIHDAGVDASDLHPGNVLVDAAGDLHLVDLTTVRFGPGLESTARARALAFFLLDLDGGPLHPDAAPLLAAYDASPRLRQRCALAWRRLSIAALRSFGQRALRACRDTTVAGEGATRIFKHRPAGALADDAVAAEPHLAEAQAHKIGRRGGVWLLEGLVAKRRSPAHARALFRAAYWLLRAGVPAPMPVALILHRDSATVWSERLPGADLRTQLGRGELDRDTVRRAARSLGSAVGRLHAHGLRNRDLKLENLLLHPRSGAVIMLDLDGVRRKAPNDRRGCAGDLGRLLAAFRHAGAPDNLATLASFLQGYNRARTCLGLKRLDPFTRRLTGARAAALASPSAGPS